jgi:hypothetical protein
MLENEQGNRVSAIAAAEHWRMLESLLQDAALATPLRAAVNQHVDTVVAGHQQGRRTIIDSTADGPGILRTLPGSWQGDYNRWHTAARQQQPNLPVVEPRHMYGMMLWYVLATDRQETWRVSMEQGHRVYELRA